MFTGNSGTKPNPLLPLCRLLEEYFITEAQSCEKAQAIALLLEKIKDANGLLAGEKDFVEQAIAAYKTQVYPYAGIFDANSQKFTIINSDGTASQKTKDELTSTDVEYLLEQVRLYHKGLLPGTTVASVLAGQLWLTQQALSLRPLLEREAVRAKLTPSEQTQLDRDYFGPVQRPSRVNLLLKNLQEEIGKIAKDQTIISIANKIDSIKIKIDSFCLHLNVYLRMREVFLAHPTLGKKYQEKYGSYQNIETLDQLAHRIKAQDLSKTILPTPIPALSSLASSVVPSSSSAESTAADAGQPEEITALSAEEADNIPGLNSMGSSLLGSLWYPEEVESEAPEHEDKAEEVVVSNPVEKLTQEFKSLERQITYIQSSLKSESNKLSFLSTKYANLAQTRCVFFLALAQYAKTVPKPEELKARLDQYTTAFAGLREFLTKQEQTIGLPSFAYVEPDDLATFIAVFQAQQVALAKRTVDEAQVGSEEKGEGKAKEKVREGESDTSESSSPSLGGEFDAGQAEGTAPLSSYVIVTTADQPKGYVFKTRPGQTFAQLKSQLAEDCGWQNFALMYNGKQPEESEVVSQQGVVAKISMEQLQQALLVIKQHYAYAPADLKSEQAVKSYLQKWPLPFLLYCPEGEATAKIFYRDKSNVIAEETLDLTAITDEASLKLSIKQLLGNKVCEEKLRVTVESPEQVNEQVKTQIFIVENKLASEQLKVSDLSNNNFFNFQTKLALDRTIPRKDYYGAILQGAKSHNNLTLKLEFEQVYQKKQSEIRDREAEERKKLELHRKRQKENKTIELIKQHYGYVKDLDDYNKGSAFIKTVPLRVVMSFDQKNALHFFSRAINGGIDHQKLEYFSYEDVIRKFHEINAVYQGSIEYLDDTNQQTTVTYQQDPDKIVVKAKSTVTYTEEQIYEKFKRAKLKNNAITKCSPTRDWNIESTGICDRQKLASDRIKAKVNEANNLLEKELRDDRKKDEEKLKIPEFFSAKSEVLPKQELRGSTASQPEPKKDTAPQETRENKPNLKNEKLSLDNELTVKISKASQKGNTSIAGPGKQCEEKKVNVKGGSQKSQGESLPKDYNILDLADKNHPLHGKDTIPLYQHIQAINAAIAEKQAGDEVTQSIKDELKPLLDELNKKQLFDDGNDEGSSAGNQGRAQLTEAQASRLLRRIDRARQNLIKLPKVWQLFATVLGGFLGACVGLVIGAVVGAAIAGTLGAVTGPGAAVAAVTGAGAGAIAGTAGGAVAGAAIGGSIGWAAYSKWLFYRGRPVETAVGKALDESAQLVKRNQ